MKEVLVFSPHPDDELIGAGGSITRHVDNGNKVSVAYMTNGEAGSSKYSKNELAKIRKQEAANSSKFLGIYETYFLENPDGYLEYNQSNLVKVINLIRKLKPEIVYLPHKNDAHKDHETTNKIVLESVRRASGPWFQETEGDPWPVKTVLCYEVWTPLAEFSYVEDISGVIDRKIKALEMHKSQIEEINYSEAVRGLNRYRGIMTGKGDYCECFQVVKISSIET